MGFLADKCEEVRRWLAIGADVYPDSVIVSWIRMAEEQLSTVLRVKHMIQIDSCMIISERAPLPLDWQEIRFVRFKDGGKGTLRYNTPDDFFNPEFPEDPDPSEFSGRIRRYTILGNYIMVDLTEDSEVELTYYQDIPPLTETTNNWINIYHPTVYTLKMLHVASLYAIEDDRGPMWEKQVADLVVTMNSAHKVDRASGSVLVPVRKKTFG